MKKIIVIILIVILVIFILRFGLNFKCDRYGLGGRSSICNDRAPFFCKTKYHSPNYVQDYESCDFVF